MTLQEKIAYDAFMKPYKKYLSGEFYEEYVDEDESDDEIDSRPGITMSQRSVMPKADNKHETLGGTRV